MLSEEEILALQCNTPDNMDNVNNPSRHFMKVLRKKNKVGQVLQPYGAASVGAPRMAFALKKWRISI